MDLTCAMAEEAPSTPTLRDTRSLAKSKTCSKHTGGPIRDGRIEGLGPQMNIPTTSTRVYIKIHRQPGLLSLPSLSLPPCFASFASSSSTMSCGLTVM